MRFELCEQRSFQFANCLALDGIRLDVDGSIDVCANENLVSAFDCLAIEFGSWDSCGLLHFLVLYSLALKLNKGCLQRLIEVAGPFQTDLLGVQASCFRIRPDGRLWDTRLFCMNILYYRYVCLCIETLHLRELECLKSPVVPVTVSVTPDFT